MEKIPVHLLPDNETDEPLPPGAKTFGFTDPEQAKKKYAILDKFLSNRNVSIYKRIAKLHKFIDWTLEDKGVKAAAVCRPNCAHCCAVDVDVSLLEALYIGKMTGKTVVQRPKRIRKGYHKHDDPYCPFLNKQTAACSIYQFRPIACRSFYTFDNRKFCRGDDDRHHAIATDMSDPVIGKIHQRLMQMGQLQHADIREWFKEYTTDPYEGEYVNNLEITEI